MSRQGSLRLVVDNQAICVFSSGDGFVGIDGILGYVIFHKIIHVSILPVAQPISPLQTIAFAIAKKSAHWHLSFFALHRSNKISLVTFHSGGMSYKRLLF